MNHATTARGGLSLLLAPQAGAPANQLVPSGRPSRATSASLARDAASLHQPAKRPWAFPCSLAAGGWPCHRRMPARAERQCASQQQRSAAAQPLGHAAPK
jgi:hypothetical protein